MHLVKYIRQLSIQNCGFLRSCLLAYSWWAALSVWLLSRCGCSRVHQSSRARTGLPPVEVEECLWGGGGGEIMSCRG